MLVQIRLAYFEKGILITDAWLIMKHYLKRLFIIDLIVFIGGIIAMTSNNIYLNAFFLLQFIKIIKLKNEFEDRFFLKSKI